MVLEAGALEDAALSGVAIGILLSTTFSFWDVALGVDELRDVFLFEAGLGDVSLWLVAVEGVGSEDNALNAASLRGETAVDAAARSEPVLIVFLVFIVGPFEGVPLRSESWEEMP